VNPSNSPLNLDDAALDARLRRLPGRGEHAAAPHPDDRALLALSAGALEEREAALVEVHLARCAECRALLAEMALGVPASVQSASEGAFPREPARRFFTPGRATILAGAIAAAAAVLVAVRPVAGPTNAPEVTHPDFDWGKVYAAEDLRGGVQTTRSAQNPESLRFIPGSRLAWTLRAASAPRVAPVVTVWVGDEGGTLRRAEPRLQRGDAGTFKLEARARELLEPGFGRKLLVVAVGGQEIDLAGQPALAAAPPTVEPARGAVFVKVLDYESGELP